MRNIQQLLKEVNRIPHLSLNFKYDAKRIEQEIRAMPYPLIEYNATMQDNHEHVKNKWSNLALYSYDGSIFCDPLEGAGPGELARIYGQFQQTGLVDYLPYTYEVINTLGAGKALARIEEIQPNAVMGWHNHVFELYHPESLMIIQLPIVMPAGFKYSVIDYKQYRTVDLGNALPRTYEASYPPGTPVVFNAYHYHNVFNYDLDTSRLTIRFFADLREDGVYDLVEEAVNSYGGEYVG